MKRFLILMFIFSIFFAANIYAQEIKIGLKTVNEYNSGESSLNVGYRSGESYISCGAAAAGGNISFKPAGGSYAKSKDVFSDFNSAKQFAANYSGAYPALCAANEWRVYKAGEGGDSVFESSVLLGTSAVYAMCGGEILFISDAPNFLQISPADGSFVCFDGTEYRGKLEFLTSGGQITVINSVDTEEYLYSVLPSEMPPSWNIEALKAQAVAARTYALFNINKHSENGYNLCTSTHCQAYNGVSAETEQTTQAVNATKGICAYYNGEPINALFSASSGGYTANAEDVWGGDAVSYLKGVKDTFDVNNADWTRSFTLSEISNMAGNIGSVYKVTLKSGEKSGRVKEMILEGTSGTKTVTGDSIRSFFSSAGGSLKSTRFAFTQGGLPAVSENNTAVSSSETSERKIYAVSSEETSEIDLTSAYITDKNSEISQNYNISVIDEKFLIAQLETEDAEVLAESSAALESSTSENEGLISTSSSNQTITFYGSGSGHGVGMSQYGANKMGELGYSYKQILEFYYSGITIG